MDKLTLGNRGELIHLMSVIRATIFVLLAIPFLAHSAEEEAAPAVTENTETTSNTEETAPPAQAALSFENGSELAKYLQDKFTRYYAEISIAISDPELQAAVATADTNTLPTIALQVQDLLIDSIKVRLFPTGLEEVDNSSTPACGFACIDIATKAYNSTPPAEALLYNSPDANITLAKAIESEAGQVVGVIVAQYPISILQDAIKGLKDIGLYTEFRQNVDGKSVPIIKHGDAQVKNGQAKQISRIDGTMWNIAVWTPGGIEVDQYEPPSIPWVHITLGVAVLVIGIIILIIYRKRHPSKPKKPAVASMDASSDAINPEAAFYDDDTEDSKTLIMGGGAAEVDVSEFLKNSGVKTTIKKPE